MGESLACCVPDNSRQWAVGSRQEERQEQVANGGRQVTKFFLPAAPASCPRLFCRVLLAFLPTASCACLLVHLFVRLADITRMIASPEGPMFRVPTTTGSPSLMLMSVFRPVLS